MEIVSMPKILVVDDEPEIRRLLRTWLEAERYEVFEAKDGAQAFELYKQVEPDLVITDIYMPNKDGLGLIRKLRSANSRAKMIAMTGGSSIDSSDPLVVAEMLGAELTVRKPFTDNDLLEAVARILRGSSAY
jgi:CheY-like chemotaxis protein